MQKNTKNSLECKTAWQIFWSVLCNRVFQSFSDWHLHIIFRARSPHLNFRVNVIPSNINFYPFNNWAGCAEYFPMRANGEIKLEDSCGYSSSGNGEKYHWNPSASCNIWSIFSDSWIRCAHRVKLSMMMMKMRVMTLAMMILMIYILWCSVCLCVTKNEHFL